MTADVDALVRGLVAQAGLPATEEEIAGWARLYPVLRAAIESLHAVEDTYDDEPAVTFRAAPALDGWRTVL